MREEGRINSHTMLPFSPPDISKMQSLLKANDIGDLQGKAEDCKSFIPGSNPGGASRD